MKYFLALIFFVMSPLPVAAVVVPKAPSLSASGWIAIDFNSGKVLAEHNATQRLEPASLTKMMTTFVVFSELEQGNISLDDEVLVSQKAWKTPGSRMFIEVDKQVRVHELLMGVIVQSGNDASVALAEYVAGDESSFAALMNQYAVQLGMSGTNFVNSTGLPDPEHYTTAVDLAKLGMALIREFPDHYAWHSIKSFEYNGIEQKNRNTLLWRDTTVDGIKTGHTEAAGYCLVASALRDGMRLVTVVLGANSDQDRSQQTQTLLNYGFRFYETHKLYGAGDAITSVRIWKGEREELPIGVKEDLFITIPRGKYEDVEASMRLDKQITAPIAGGQTFGKVLLQLEGEAVTDRPLIALESVREGNLWRKMTDGVKLWLE